MTVRAISVMYLIRTRIASLPDDAAPAYRRIVRVIGTEDAGSAPVSNSFAVLFDSEHDREARPRGSISFEPRYTVVVDGGAHTVAASDVENAVSFMVAQCILDDGGDPLARFDAIDHERTRFGVEFSDWAQWHIDVTRALAA